MKLALTVGLALPVVTAVLGAGALEAAPVASSEPPAAGAG
ncbi:hypothetical protein GCM10027610_136680 [Dactylosporangium cerinum]